MCMGKEHTTLSIDGEVLKRAKEKGLNLSGELERAIIHKFNEEKIKQEAAVKCDFCGIELERQTSKNLNKGLCWLVPDDKWICPKCLKNKATKIIIGVTEGI